MNFVNISMSKAYGHVLDSRNNSRNQTFFITVKLVLNPEVNRRGPSSPAGMCLPGPAAVLGGAVQTERNARIPTVHKIGILHQKQGFKEAPGQSFPDPVLSQKVSPGTGHMTGLSQGYFAQRPL